MADIALMWHGSFQWGRRQVEEWHFLQEIYAATLNVLEKHPNARMTVQFGGQDVEWLAHTHPEFIAQVTQLRTRGQIEIAMGGYSHNFQGATPEINLANLEFAQRICRRVFGVSAAGYWPAESMLNRGMPKALRETGFEYTLFDSLNVSNAGDLEFDITGKTFSLKGAFNEAIDGLPVSRFTDGTARGEGAGIQRFTQTPSYYNHEPAVILDRVSRTPLVVEVSDWEHFNKREQAVHDVGMGTFSIGSSRNRIDPEKIAAWDRILTSLEEAGHTLITCREALARHPRSGTLELVDGRDYNKNDLTRLVDACAWYNSKRGGLSERTDPHRMSDQESYCYSFAGAKALRHLQTLRETTRRQEGDDVESRIKDVLISFCSAHRSGGEDFTVKQQLLDRIDRVIGVFHEELSRDLTQEDEGFFPEGLPDGYWPVSVNLLGSAPLAYDVMDGARRATAAWVEANENRTACLDRSHRLWVKGPLAAGRYTFRPVNTGITASTALNVDPDETGIVVRSGEGYIRFDALNGGNLTEWSVEGFTPFCYAGRLEMNSRWQDAPVMDEMAVSLEWKRLAFGVQVTAAFQLKDVPVERTWLVTDDLHCCQTDVTCRQRRFIYLSPFAYRLHSKDFGVGGKVWMVSEGYTRVAAESLMTFHNVHHLGSELIGFQGPAGIVSIAVNRLSSSPILRRHPLSGVYVLMESRPLDAVDKAIVYEFAQNPIFEATLRLQTGAAALMPSTFEQWQSFYNRPPILRLGAPVLRQSQLEWAKSFPHISEVNPYF